MHINKITKEGNIEALDYDAHFEIINDEDDYLIALVIGDDDEGIVLTFDAKEFEEFRRTMMLAKRELINRIKAIHKLDRALAEEFFSD